MDTQRAAIIRAAQNGADNARALGHADNPEAVAAAVLVELHRCGWTVTRNANPDRCAVCGDQGWIPKLPRHPRGQRWTPCPECPEGTAAGAVR